MNRNEILKDIESTAGFVPSFFKRLPDTELQQEWQLFRSQLMDKGAIPNKYRELIGLAVASAVQCPYCIHAHTKFAQAFGANDQEIEDAVHTAKHSAGWSTYLAGLGLELPEFKKEVDRIADHMRKQM